MKCKKCGKELRTIEMLGIKRTLPCDCQMEKWAEEDAKNREFEMLERKRKLRVYSNLGKKYESKTFDNFKVTEKTQEMFNTCKKYADEFDKKNAMGILIGSRPGVGKTHLMAAITNQLIEQNMFVVFMPVPDLLQEFKNSYQNKDISEEKLLHKLTHSALLILDDIGAEKTTDWTTDRLYTVINNRYINNKPMIFTTNCDLKELKNRLGERVVSRIMEVCEVLQVDAGDYRGKIYLERKANEK